MGIFNCPYCQETLTDAQCVNGHTFEEINGVLRLVTSEFLEKINPFLEKFEPVRAQHGHSGVQKEDFAKLPEIGVGKDWAYRTQDLKSVRSIIGYKRGLRILEIGSWIGWMANNLTENSHEVTGTGYFTNELDGLEAKKHYDNDWEAIQMDLENLPINDQSFDVIICNRNLQYFINPIGMFDTLMNKIKPGGVFIVSGMYFYSSKVGHKKVTEQRRSFENDYGFSPQFVPVKGYLDHADYRYLEARGMKFEGYESKIRTTLKYIMTNKPMHYLGYVKKVK